MTIADDRCVNKCRVRTAHAASRRGIKRVRGAHPTTVSTPIRHSRDGGNPASFANDTGSPPSRGRRIKGRWNIEDYFLVDAQWIPAFAGMIGGKSALILFRKCL